MEEYENNSLNGCTNRKDQDDSQAEAIRAEETEQSHFPQEDTQAVTGQESASSQPEDTQIPLEQASGSFEPEDASLPSEQGTGSSEPEDIQLPPEQEAAPTAQAAEPVGERTESSGAYHNAGAGRRESPYADSPYEMNRQSWQQSRPTGDWETAYRPVETAKKQKAPKKPRQRKGWGTGRVVAAALACAIVGGVGGGALTAHLVDSKWEKTTEELQSSFQSQLDDLANAQNAIQHGNGSGATVDTVSNPGALTPAQVYAQNVQSVVAITNQGVKNGTFGQESFTGTGSGFILTADGYVLTNHHVIDGAQTITVTLYDGTEYTARLVGSDSISDVALLKIEAENLPAVTIGDSDGLDVGDQVAAIGNPLGELTSTQTVGYVSAKDRSVNTDGTILNMLQTDAAINSGNSGGPLFNMNGEVVGITTAKYSGSTSSGASIEGIGFAIPINDVMDLVDDLMEYGYITGQAYLGVTINTQDLDAATAAAYGLPLGARVQSVTEGSCADKAGLQAGDIITALGDEEVSGYSDLLYALRNFGAGDTTTVSVFRSGQELTLNITFDEKTADTPTGPVQETQPEESTQPEENSGEMPDSGSYEDWYNYFFPFFGNGND